MTDEQRRLFRETQAVMSLLEGFSDYVMDEVGRDLVPGRRADQREVPRAAPRPAVAVRAGGHAPDRHGREDGAVPQGRARSSRAIAAVGGTDRAATGSGPGPRRCRGTARSTIRRPGSPAGRRGRRVTDAATRVTGRRTPPDAPARAPARAAPRPRSPCRRSCRPATGRATSSGSARPRPGARIVTLSREGLTDEPVDDVEVLLRGWLSSDAFDRLLARAPRLTWVHSASAGRRAGADAGGPGARHRDHERPRACSRGRSPSTSLMMILAVSRRLPGLLELQRERTWQPLEGVELRDVTVGIVGLGSIGRAVGALATAFGCRVVAVRRRAEAGAEADRAAGRRVALVRRGDARPRRRARDAAGAARRVGLRRPGRAADARDREHDRRRRARRDEARRVADQRRPRRGWSTSGRCSGRSATDRIGGAVLDTFRDEPLPPTSPFYDLPNVIVTPHTSWSSGRVLDRSVELFCDNLRRYAAGEPLLNVVDPAAGY